MEWRIFKKVFDGAIIIRATIFVNPLDPRSELLIPKHVCYRHSNLSHSEQIWSLIYDNRH